MLKYFKHKNYIQLTKRKVLTFFDRLNLDLKTYRFDNMEISELQ